jgi:poly(A) polymerase
MTERKFATDVVSRLKDAGYQALWAGGCVRDELLGLPPADYDVATAARPEQVQRLFRRCHAVGAAFGVVEVLGDRGPDGQWLKVQVATFRSDGTYSDGRRPDSVTYSSPEEDAKRRDFTINGLFLDPLTRKLTDYVGGQDDLRAKILRAIGDPAERFVEDKLRILRAVRMAARFELTVDPATLDAGRRMAGQIAAVSAERSPRSCGSCSPTATGPAGCG